ncbi:unnamed protein product [Protopolystoma xenopodis]|uniref:Uncharacterized protein n=1 Tax=Protopolystoma xenopodis TaxID=117903 RepID=A0A448XGE3_9PLAT|nr:unnamed protein product [Protopolystoma xenopodis]
MDHVSGKTYCHPTSSSLRRVYPFSIPNTNSMTSPGLVSCVLIHKRCGTAFCPQLSTPTESCAPMPSLEAPLDQALYELAKDSLAQQTLQFGFQTLLKSLLALANSAQASRL